MKLAVAVFTNAGEQLAQRLCGQLEKRGHTAVYDCLYDGAAVRYPSDLRSWAQDAFSQNDGLVFIAACGIAVRAVAPHLRDKLTDPAVLAVDQQGKFVVPIVSGHVGGANKLAREIARLTGGVAVISTATDLQGCFAVDVWAAQNQLMISDRESAKQVSAALLRGETIGFSSDFLLDGILPNQLTEGEALLGIRVSFKKAKTPFTRTLWVVPCWLILGVGCRKDLSIEVFEREVLALLARLELPIEAICRLATIDLKQEEPCIKGFCAKYRIPLVAATPEQLNAQTGKFTASEFVREVTGVDNVCERAAVWAGGQQFLVKKQANNGVTLALAVERRGLVFDEAT